MNGEMIMKDGPAFGRRGPAKRKSHPLREYLTVVLVLPR